MKNSFSFLILFSAFFIPGLLRAQGLGSISGTVTDPQGAVVVAAEVKAVEEATGLSRTATTDAQGYFAFSALKPADYTVSVAAKGFQKLTQTKVTLLTDQ